MKMNLTKIIPCSLVIILLSCSEVKLPDFNVYAEGQKEVLDAFGFTFDPSLIRHETIKAVSYTHLTLPTNREV